MATPLYDALVVKLRSWVNRDSTVLTDNLISDFFDYSADFCYRKLRIPPLEHTFSYTAVSASDVGETELTLPTDLSEIIQLRRTDANGQSRVFDEVASLLAIDNKNYTNPVESYARKGGKLVFYPEAKEGDIYELYYYRRLPDLDATYVANATNLAGGLLTASNSGVSGAVEVPSSSGNYYIGNEVANWLRDSNERLLLWGAIAYALDYVGDDDRSNKFNALQLAGIEELNSEEGQRRSRGGSQVQNFANTAML
jgi:hypothetical protein|tara:strand:+ start:1265 stop:2026 length:762 start_codon:yes stop_codon:yes gene_type:complete